MKKLFSFFLFLNITLITVAQSDGSGHDVGVSIGPSFALTDLGGANKLGAPFIRDLDFKATRFTVSGFYRYNVNKWVALRANLMWAMLSASDKNVTGCPNCNNGSPDNSWYRSLRNLNFTSHIFEFQAIGEVNLKKYMHDVAGKRQRDRWAPYVGGGLGFFWFNPYSRAVDGDGNSTGDKVKLRKLGTEGQGIIQGSKIYSSFQFDLVALIGIKFNVTDKLSIALEGVYHQTFTDYLDDVSGNHPDFVVFDAMSDLAKQFSDRSQEPGAPWPQQIYHDQHIRSPGPNGKGYERGDDNVIDTKGINDQFFQLQLTFSISLGEFNRKAGFGCGRKNPYNTKFACPKW
jgi:hypothetical protein